MTPAILRIAIWRGHLRRFLFDRDRGVSGVAAIELALVAPILVLMLVASFDLGLGLYRDMQVQTAAQAGAQYAIEHGYTSSSAIANAVTSATSYSGVSASPAPSRFCGCVSNGAISNVTCTSVCADGTSPGTYVRASSKATYTTILPYPTIPNSFTLTSQSTVRIQ